MISESVKQFFSQFIDTKKNKSNPKSRTHHNYTNLSQIKHTLFFFNEKIYSSLKDSQFTAGHSV